jgi:hypothetical protein
LAQAAREIVATVVAAAQRNHRLPVKATVETQAAAKSTCPNAAPPKRHGSWRRSGDELTAFYVTAAAARAELLPKEFRAQAFFLGLAVALDTSEYLRKVPVMGDMIREIEPDAERARRLKVLGLPTLRDRHDLAQHFFISAAIAAGAGRHAAEAAGLAKELHDADGGSGFSFSDWCADLAGIDLNERVRTGKFPLTRLIAGFRVDDYLPRVSDLKDGMTEAEFARLFGSPSDKRFGQVDDEIRKRIAG